MQARETCSSSGPRWLLTPTQGQAAQRTHLGPGRQNSGQGWQASYIIQSISGRRAWGAIFVVWAGSPGPALLPHTSPGFCVTLICPTGLLWEAFPLCFHPGLVLPARVRTPGNLRQNSSNTELLQQTPDGICYFDLGCSEQAGATHPPPLGPSPAQPSRRYDPYLARCKTRLLRPLNHIARASHSGKFPKMIQPVSQSSACDLFPTWALVT